MVWEVLRCSISGSYSNVQQCGVLPLGVTGSGCVFFWGSSITLILMSVNMRGLHRLPRLAIGDPYEYRVCPPSMECSAVDSEVEGSSKGGHPCRVIVKQRVSALITTIAALCGHDRQ